MHMTYKEKYILTKYFDLLNMEIKKDLAKVHKTTVNGLKKCLQDGVFKLDNLSINHKKWLKRCIVNMNEDELAVIEKINHLSIDTINVILESEVEDYGKR